MKNEARVFFAVAAFFVVIGTAYWLVSYEQAGSVMLAASAAMGLVTGGSIWLLARHAPPRTEDLPDASIADGDGPVDVFPLHSVWPFAVGLSATVMASGFAFGAWLVVIGAAALFLALAGFVRETRNSTVPGE
ncbi:MAG: cytochrome c oxidase subunit 4 [Acidimicrobiia bacterium]